MEEKVIPINENNLNQIRSSAEKLTIQSDMRRKLIGGISEEDVVKYIDSVRQQFQLIEDELKQNIKVLQTSKDEMRREFDNYRQKTLEEKAGLKRELDNALAESSGYMDKCNEMDARYNSDVDRLTDENRLLEGKCDELSRQLAASKQEAEDLNASSKDTDMLKQRIAILEETLNENQSKLEEGQRIRERLERELEMKTTEAVGYDEIKNSLEAKVDELEGQLRESRKKAEEYSEACKTMEQQLKGERENIKRTLEDKVNLNSKVLGVKGEIEAIYKQLNSLNEQVNLNDNLHNQLELERTRAEKAEKELSQFGEWVSGLKDRFHKDQKKLEVQFVEIEEKERAMQADINGLRTNMENFCMDMGTEIDDLYGAAENAYQLLERK